MPRVLTLLCLFWASFAVNAALIPFVNKTTNDGVFSLSETQARFMGVSDATHIAFLRLRKGRGVSWQAGDRFDLNTVLNSTGHDNKILGVFNGLHNRLNYEGEAFAPFISATLEKKRNGYFRGIAFAFDAGRGNVVFNGTSTFNGRQSRGAADFIAVPALSESNQSAQSANTIPEPSILALYLAATVVLLMSKYLRTRKHH